MHTRPRAKKELKLIYQPSHISKPGPENDYPVGNHILTRICNMYEMGALSLTMMLRRANKMLGEAPSEQIVCTRRFIIADLYAVFAYAIRTGKPRQISERKKSNELSITEFQRMYQLWKKGETMQAIHETTGISRKFVTTICVACNKEAAEEMRERVKKFETNREQYLPGSSRIADDENQLTCDLGPRDLFEIFRLELDRMVNSGQLDTTQVDGNECCIVPIKKIFNNQCVPEFLPPRPPEEVEVEQPDVFDEEPIGFTELVKSNAESDSQEQDEDLIPGDNGVFNKRPKKEEAEKLPIDVVPDDEKSESMKSFLR